MPAHTGVTTIGQRIIASSAWFSANNPMLPPGWEAYEDDTRKTKIGDGVTAYASLTYNSEPGTTTLNTGQATLNGTTAGTAVSSQPFTGSSYKKFIVFLNGYRNSTVTAQTITYPTAFSNSPKLVSDDSAGASTNTTTLTLPASMGATKTGWIIVEGY